MKIHRTEYTGPVSELGDHYHVLRAEMNTKKNGGPYSFFLGSAFGIAMVIFLMGVLGSCSTL